MLQLNRERHFSEVKVGKVCPSVSNKQHRQKLVPRVTRRKLPPVTAYYIKSTMETVARNLKEILCHHFKIKSKAFIYLYASSMSESIEWRDWQTEGPTPGWGSLWESSSFVPWFFTYVFRNVPGTVPECVRICGFKSNSSNLDRAHKMRDSVLLNSWESFLVTLPSISSETCVIYSSLILGTDVFRDWPFLGFSSCVPLVTAANFRLFLNVANFWRENATQLWSLN